MRKHFKKFLGIVGVVSLLVGVLAPMTSPAPVKATTAWNIGDVFAGVAGGSYKVYDNNGVFKETISDGLGGFTTGCTFNASLDKLYTTNFSNTKVVVYNDASPHTIAQTINTGATSPGGHSESIVFDAAGNFYVGHPDGNDLLHKYDAAGNLITTFAPAIQNRGTDWNDLSSDQQTMFYTSEGGQIKRFDVANNVQLADFANIGGISYALRLLPPGDGSGGLLVANSVDAKRLDGTGAVVQTYDAPGENLWFSLNLDPNGTSFWAGDFGTNNFYRFNITTGAIEVGPIASGGSLFGLCVKGELTAAQVQITLDPPTDTNAAGSNHTVTATITVGGNPVPNELVSFSVVAGPNTGQVSDPGECSVDPNCNTDANGQTSWTYTSNGLVGVDTIQACFTDKQGKEHCAKAEKEWVDRTPPEASCIETVNPHGNTVPPAGKTTPPGTNPNSGDNEDGFYELTATDNSGLPVEILVMNLSGSASFGPFSSGDKVKITEAPGTTPSSKPMGSSNGQAGAIAAHIRLDSDAVVQATDAAGNVTTVTCFVPPPPK